ncbi:MAG: VOC family protein [Pseudomonadota bacterium]
MITNARFVIAVPDLAASAAFYCDVLGFEVREVGDPGWRFFVKDSCCIMAGECPDAIPPREMGDHSYFAYIDVDNVDDYFAAVRDAGAEVLKEPRTEPWGMREFAIRTGDGHRIIFGQDTE